MGMNKDLKLVGNEFTNAATALFIANLIAEVPTGTFIICLCTDTSIMH